MMTILLIYIISSLIKLYGFIKTSYLLLLAEFLHSLSDVAILVILYYSLKIAKKPADISHPFGHGLASNIGSLVAGLCFITIISFELGIESVRRMVYGYEIDQNEFGVVYMILSLFPVIIGYFLSKKRSVVEETARYELRNDLLSGSFAVLGLYLSIYYKIVDSSLSLLIAVFIAYNGYSIFKKNAKILLGKSPEVEFYEKVKDVISGFEKVKNVHDVIATFIGENDLHVDMHIVVDENMKVGEADKLTESIARKLKEEIPEIKYVIIHVCSEGKDRLRTTYDRIMGDLYS